MVSRVGGMTEVKNGSKSFQILARLSVDKLLDHPVRVFYTYIFLDGPAIPPRGTLYVLDLCKCVCTQTQMHRYI